MQFYFEIDLVFTLKIIPIFFVHHLEKDGSGLPKCHLATNHKCGD
jgi:hypothetical protein